jgi:RimJ/RimL family protein N-acetyltransferase
MTVCRAMNESLLERRNLRLVPVSAAEARMQVEAMSAAEKAHLSADWLALLAGARATDPWIHGFSLVHRDSGTVIGSAGFKGPPDCEGNVEIAYGVAPEHQGKGFATEAAQALVAYAFSREWVRSVRAHTLPQANASTRVLTKCGFRRVGEVIDPEDGLVWRWELARTEIHVPTAQGSRRQP